MIGLGLTFIAGRYHATAWDRHVNEGVCEWPPAPLRVLRALAAALFERSPDLDRERALRVLGKLTPPPSYRLPPAWSEGHTRHYLSRNQVERTATALAFDAFISLREPGERETPDVVVQWDVDLAAEERAILARLAGRVTYLGRAESWCLMRLLDERELELGQANCRPGSADVEGRETRLLCPAAGITAEHLLQETALVREEGYGQPPGTRWVRYELPVPQRRQQRVERVAGAQVAEFALGGTVLPRLTEAIRVAELFRRAALSVHGPSQTLSGHDGEHRMLRDDHGHAHYLPECRDGSGRITHVVVYAPVGFTASEAAALARIRYLSWKLYEETKKPQGPSPELRRNIEWIPTQDERRQEGSGALDVVLCGLDRRDTYEGTSRLFGWGKEWRSQTPFVLPRHVHGRRERDQPEAQLRTELARRLGGPARLLVEEIGGVEVGPEQLDWSRFRRWRAGQWLTTGVYGYRLLFEEAVQGPLLLGANSHFGLGQFMRVCTPMR